MDTLKEVAKNAYAGDQGWEFTGVNIVDLLCLAILKDGENDQVNKKLEELINLCLLFVE